MFSFEISIVKKEQQQENEEEQDDDDDEQTIYEYTTNISIALNHWIVL